MSRKIGVNFSSMDAIEILTEDHKKVLQMFAEFETLRKDKEDDKDAKQVLVERVCTELTIHLQVEEEFFYPALREAFEESDLLDEAEVEHAIANQLIMELESMEPGDDLYDAKFTVLGEYVRHHIDEEQEKLFPKAKRTKLDWNSLGEEIHRREVELHAEFGMPEDDEEIPKDETKSGHMQKVLDSRI